MTTLLQKALASEARCVLSTEIDRVFTTEEKRAEVRELLQADIATHLKRGVLIEEGLHISESQFRTKMREGCTCPGCVGLWCGDGSREGRSSD